jgi:hypothetical protein
VTDDAALLLRVSVFGLVAGAVYWFLSYEALGTVALLVLGAGPGFAALFIIRHRRQGVERGSRTAMLRSFVGVPSGDPPGPKSLEDEDLAVLPAGSLWPFAASLGLAVAGSGFVFGLWLVIVGLGIALYSGWGWVAAIEREARYGHVEPTDRPERRDQEVEREPAHGGSEQRPLRRR